jgi:hypothetical protein
VLELIPLAIAASVYPTVLAVVILILTRPNPRRLLAAYLAGGMLASLIAGGLVVAALSSGHLLNGNSGRTINPAVDLAVGLLLLGLLYALLTGRDRRFTERRRHKHAADAGAEKPSWSDRMLERDSLGITFALGLAVNLPGALYLVALKDIASADQSTAADVLQIVVFNLIMFACVEIPLIGYGVAPERTEALVARAHDWLGVHSRQMAVALCGIAAVYLTIKGTVGLLS